MKIICFYSDNKTEEIKKRAAFKYTLEGLKYFLSQATGLNEF